MYPTAFLNAVAKTLVREGGYVDDPVDPGGATNYGISLRFLRKAEPGDWDLDGDGDVDADDIKLLSKSDAIDLYHRHFWQTAPLEEPSYIVEKWFDTSVNMGPRMANKILQRALTSVSGKMVDDDGLVGPQTKRAITSAVETIRGSYAVLFCMKSEQAAFYRELIAKKPVFQKYRNGWLRRAYDL